MNIDTQQSSMTLPSSLKSPLTSHAILPPPKHTAKDLINTEISKISKSTVKEVAVSSDEEETPLPTIIKEKKSIQKRRPSYFTPLEIISGSDPIVSEKHSPPRRSSSIPQLTSATTGIEKYLSLEKKKYHNFLGHPKILLLGSADSGKSTVLKQMKILYGQGFTATEKTVFCKEMILNIMTVMLALDLKNGSSQSSYGVQASVDIISSSQLSVSDINGSCVIYQFLDFSEEWAVERKLPLPEEITKFMISLWDVAENRERFDVELSSHFPESTSYFLSHLSRCLSPQYEPTNDDYLMLRISTNQITETKFTIDKRQYHIYDVGGQKRLRKSWIPYFDKVHCIVFVTSLSCFDKNLAEDSTINQMLDSLVLFEDLTNHPLLYNLEFILFLNKKDLFKIKVKSGTAKLSRLFPAYTGAINDVEASVKFIRAMFVEKKRIGLPPIVHLTHATNTSTIKVIVRTVLTGVVAKNLKAAGLF